MKTKQISDAGSVASLDVGTSEGNVLQLDSSGKIPAVDGSALTGISGGGTVTAALIPSIVGVSSTPYNVSSTASNGTIFYIDINGATSNISVYLPAASDVSSGTYFTFSTNDSSRRAYIFPDAYPSNTDKFQGFLNGAQLFSDSSITVISDGSSNWIYAGLGTQ